MENNLSEHSWIFLGTPQIAVDFLEEVFEKYRSLPTHIICNPDAPTGRKQVMTPPPTKLFAIKHNIPYIQTTNLDDCIQEMNNADVACVLAFGSLLKQHHLDAPTHGCLNIHPSLLPDLRGPSPIISTMLDNQKNTGVTLMKLSLAMDAGPIIAQSPWQITHWEKYQILEKKAAQIGARLFHDYIDDYIKHRIFPEEQNHERATYCAKYNKSDMEIDLATEAEQQFSKYCAFDKPFFFGKNSGQRFVITQAQYQKETDRFIIERVIPAGKKERPFTAQDLD